MADQAAPAPAAPEKKKKAVLSVKNIASKLQRGQTGFEAAIKEAHRVEHKQLMKYRGMLQTQMEDLAKQRMGQTSVRAINEVKRREYEAALVLSDVNARVAFLKKFVKKAAVAYNLKQNHSYKHEEDVNQDVPIVASVVFTNHGFLYSAGSTAHCGEPRDGGVWTILTFQGGTVWYLRQMSSSKYLSLTDNKVTMSDQKSENCRWECTASGMGSYALHQGPSYITIKPSATDQEPQLELIKGVPSTVLKVTNPCMGTYFSYQLEGAKAKMEYFVFNGRNMFSAASPKELDTKKIVDWPVIDIKYVRRSRAGFKLLKIDDVNKDRKFDAGDKTYLYEFKAPPKKIDLWIMVFRACGVKIRKESE